MVPSQQTRANENGILALQADRFAQCKDGHMLKYTAFGAALDGRQNSSGAFSGPRVTMCVACCVRVIDPARLCSLCKIVEDAAAKEVRSE